MVNMNVRNEMASQPPVVIDLVDVKKFIRTRTLDFRFEFTRETVMEVLNALNKMIEFDRIMKTDDKLKVLRINVYSYGGHCASLLALTAKIEQMQEMGYRVHTHNESTSCSCGFVLSILGDYKTGTPYCTYLNHQVSAGGMGTFAELEVSLDDIRKMQNTFKEIIHRHCPKVPMEELERPYLTNRDITYSAEEAKALGFIDEIILG